LTTEISIPRHRIHEAPLTAAQRQARRLADLDLEELQAIDPPRGYGRD
jgi:hypothetical protein